MDDLRSALAPFDPDAPLTAAPDPWDYLPMPANVKDMVRASWGKVTGPDGKRVYP